MAMTDPRRAEADILLNHVRVLAAKLAIEPPGPLSSQYYRDMLSSLLSGHLVKNALSRFLART
jgi:hypothetical protein